jgi:hypothetical protein
MLLILHNYQAVKKLACVLIHTVQQSSSDLVQVGLYFILIKDSSCLECVNEANLFRRHLNCAHEMRSCPSVSVPSQALPTNHPVALDKTPQILRHKGTSNLHSTKICQGFFHISFRPSLTRQWPGSLCRDMAEVSLISGSPLLSTCCAAPLLVCNAETNITRILLKFVPPVAKLNFTY